MIRINVKVKPNSSIAKIKEIDSNTLEIKLTAPPHDGEANQQLVKILSKYYKCPKSAIKIVNGEKQKNKIIEIDI